MQLLTLIRLMIFTSIVSALPATTKAATLTKSDLKKLNQLFSSDEYKDFVSSRSMGPEDRVIPKSEGQVYNGASKLRDGR